MKVIAKLIAILEKRLKTLESQLQSTQQLKQFKRETDPAKKTFIISLSARINELKNSIKIISDG